MITLPDFVGLWTLSRTIDDLKMATTGHFTGTALFEPADDGLIYQETGQLVIKGQAPMTATRRYLWDQSGDQIQVRFDDGRHFHSFAPNQPVPSASHDCAPDAYEVRYDFSDWPCWLAQWRVTGPRKDYTMQSRYSR